MRLVRRRGLLTKPALSLPSVSSATLTYGWVWKATPAVTGWMTEPVSLPQVATCDSVNIRGKVRGIAATIFWMAMINLVRPFLACRRNNLRYRAFLQPRALDYLLQLQPCRYPMYQVLHMHPFSVPFYKHNPYSYFALNRLVCEHGFVERNCE